ncbi:winged helix-turn-helix transcriptional regulator [Paenisporosarcina sp.]|uniref:winged helix-turn-helix transcriptional regulator n=1 Tax=Paenisporosarcina sp. TaxID=1932001 RepID=UPI003C755553
MSKVKKEYDCALVLTIDLIGGKWKLIILWYLISGAKRFGELKKSIPSITQKMLTEQLRELEERAIISRKVYATVPPKVEYAMTDFGTSLIPLINGLCTWTEEYAKENDITLHE